MWYMTYGSVLVGPDSFHRLEKSIREWFAHHKHTMCLFIHGPCGSGKTQILKRNIPGVYLADEDTTPVNDNVLPTHIPIFNYTRGMVNSNVRPMQIFESCVYPSVYERTHYFANTMFVTTQNCIPTNQMLTEYIHTIMMSLNLTDVTLPPVNIINGDVRAELTRIEFHLEQMQNQINNYSTTRMEQLINGANIDLSVDYFVLQENAYNYFDPDKWSELNSRLDAYDIWHTGDENDLADLRMMQNDIIDNSIKHMLLNKPHPIVYRQRNAISKLPPFSTLYTWNLVYKYKSLWRYKRGRWELFVNDQMTDQDIIKITQATFEDMYLYFKSQTRQDIIKQLKLMIIVFWRNYIKDPLLRKRYNKYISQNG